MNRVTINDEAYVIVTENVKVSIGYPTEGPWFEKSGSASGFVSPALALELGWIEATEEGWSFEDIIRGMARCIRDHEGSDQMGRWLRRADLSRTALMTAELRPEYINAAVRRFFQAMEGRG